MHKITCEVPLASSVLRNAGRTYQIAATWKKYRPTLISTKYIANAQTK